MAQPLRLNIAIADYGHTRALKSGAVPIEGVEPNFIEVKPIIGAFRRMVRDVEFDVCEMAPTTYMIARALGAPFIAIPVVVMRRFHHGGFVVRPDSGIKVPKDLEGKRLAFAPTRSPPGSGLAASLSTSTALIPQRSLGWSMTKSMSPP